MLETLAKYATRRTLLLAGGAFGIAAVLWAAASFRPVADLGRLYPEADAAVAILAHGPKVDAVLKALPASLAYALDGDAAVGRLRRGAEGLAWEPAEAALDFGAVLFVPRKTVAYGFLAVGGRRVPFTVTATDKTLSAEFGRRLAGWNGRPGLSAIKPRIGRLPEETAGYAYFPAGLEAVQVGRDTAFGAFLPLLETIGRPAEVLFHASTTAETGFGGFVIHGPGGTHEAWQSDVERVTADFLGAISPVSRIFTLKDGTQGAELLALSAEKIGFRHLKTGSITKFAPSDLSPALYFDDQDGVWIASETRIIQSAVFSGITYGLDREADPCPNDPLEARLVLVPKNFMRLFPDSLGDIQLLRIFSRLEISLNEVQTGLFTVCGQF